MLKSGISLTEGIAIIEEQSINQKFKKVLKDIGDNVHNGQSLFKTLSKYPHLFDPFYLHLIKIGEESGNLVSNLNYLSETMKKNYDFKKKIQGALLYPEIILGTAVVVGGGISIFVLPQMADLFKSLDVKLPLTTQILIGTAQVMKVYGIIIFGAIVGLIFLAKFLLNAPKVKPHWHHSLLSFPFIGQFMQHIELASMCRNIGMMLKSGLPITTALDTQMDSTTNLVYRKYLETILKGVKDGKTIQIIITNNKMKFIPLLATKMIGVGETSGKLDESFLYLGEFFEDEVDVASKDLATVLEPMILFVVGIIVAFIAIAIISPIYQFTGGVSNEQ